MNRATIAALATPILMALTPGSNDVHDEKSEKTVVTREVLAQEERVREANEAVRVVSVGIQLAKRVCLNRIPSNISNTTCVVTSTETDRGAQERFRVTPARSKEKKYEISMPFKDGRGREVVSVTVDSGIIGVTNVVVGDAKFDNDDRILPGGEPTASSVSDSGFGSCSVTPGSFHHSGEVDAKCSDVIKDADILK